MNKTWICSILLMALAAEARNLASPWEQQWASEWQDERRQNKENEKRNRLLEQQRSRYDGFMGWYN